MDFPTNIFQRALFVMFEIRHKVICEKVRIAQAQAQTLLEKKTNLLFVLIAQQAELRAAQQAVPCMNTDMDETNMLTRESAWKHEDQKMRAELELLYDARHLAVAENNRSTRVFESLWFVVFQGVVEPRFWQEKTYEWAITEGFCVLVFED